MSKVVVVDLADEKTKKVAQTITSATSRKILELLASGKLPASKIAAQLSFGLPVVHYHLHRLQDAGLVVAKEFGYSEKGREMNYYEVVSPFIVIAPSMSEGFLEKLRSVLPVGIVALGVSFVVYWVNRVSVVSEASVPQAVAERATSFSLDSAAAVTPSYLWLWVLLSSVGALLLYVVLNWAWDRFRKH